MHPSTLCIYPPDYELPNAVLVLQLTPCALFCNRCTEYRRPKMHTLCSLNHLLVHRVRRMVHQHRPLLVVELPIHARIANEVHNPFLAFVLVEAEAGGEIPGKDLLVQDPTGNKGGLD